MEDVDVPTPDRVIKSTRDGCACGCTCSDKGGESASASVFDNVHG
jgi:hypothetical protein